jgi:ketosteroid isomerase-like protein
MKIQYAIAYLLIVSLVACTGMETETDQFDNIEESVDALFEAMMDADETSLMLLLSEDLSYGHSSGVIQNKTEFIEEILSGKPIKLTNIRAENQTINISEHVAIVRHNFLSDGINAEGETIPIRIGNCLVWKKENDMWKLLVRQAFRL